jgi:hypothetical protein
MSFDAMGDPERERERDGERKSIKYQQFRINVYALEIFPNYTTQTYRQTHTHTHKDYYHRHFSFFSSLSLFLGLKECSGSFMAILGEIVKMFKNLNAIKLFLSCRKNGRDKERGREWRQNQVGF